MVKCGAGKRYSKLCSDADLDISGRYTKLIIGVVRTGGERYSTLCNGGGRLRDAERYIKPCTDVGLGTGQRYTKQCIDVEMRGGEWYMKLCSVAGLRHCEKHIEMY